MDTNKKTQKKKSGLRSQDRSLQTEQLGSRVPRPMGLTMQMYHLNKTRETDNTNSYQDKMLMIKITMIEQWASAGMMLNGVTYTMEQVSQYVNLPISIVTKYMWKALGKMGRIWDNGPEKEGHTRALFSLILKKSLEIQSQSQQQVQILLDSQDGHYQAFISSTVNQALANLNTTQMPLLRMLEMLQPKVPTTAIQNNFPQGTPQSGTPIAMNQEAAMVLIKDSQLSMLDDPHLANPLIEKYQLANLLPEINPNYQRVGEITKLKVFDDGEGNKDIEKMDVKVITRSTTTHENRRQKAERILDIDIEDADEFKA